MSISQGTATSNHHRLDISISPQVWSRLPSASHHQTRRTQHQTRPAAEPREAVDPGSLKQRLDSMRGRPMSSGVVLGVNVLKAPGREDAWAQPCLGSVGVRENSKAPPDRDYGSSEQLQWNGFGTAQLPVVTASHTVTAQSLHQSNLHHQRVRDKSPMNPISLADISSRMA